MEVSNEKNNKNRRKRQNRKNWFDINDMLKALAIKVDELKFSANMDYSILEVRIAKLEKMKEVVDKLDYRFNSYD